MSGGLIVAQKLILIAVFTAGLADATLSSLPFISFQSDLVNGVFDSTPNIFTPTFKICPHTRVAR